MTTIVRQGQTITTNGDDPNVILRGNDNVTFNLPAPYAHSPLDITSSGNNTVQINQGVVGSYDANVVANSGTLTFEAFMYSGANVTLSGRGHIKFNEEIGGRYGGSHLTVDAKDDGSTAFVINNGSIEYQKMSFLQSSDVTLYDEGTPVPGFGGPPPVLTIDSMPKIISAGYEESAGSNPGGLTLDFANGSTATFAGLHIQDDSQYYSLVQDHAGKVTIEATASGFSPATGFQYAAPVTPVGGKVFEL